MATLAAEVRPSGQDTDDLDLVSGIRDGDDRAFELLYARYQPRIALHIRGMVQDDGRAEDITQDVFFSALRRMRETDCEIVVKPWLYGIATNACIDAFRRSRHTTEVSIDADDAMNAEVHAGLADTRATPDRAVDAKVDLDNLCGAFGGLSENHHQILVLRELEGLSYRDIGERLGMSRPAVESTLFRARRRLEEEYDELVSGKRCIRVRGIVDTGGRAAGVRDQRRMDRHVSHCQPCRRYALAAGVDLEARPQRLSIPARIAALLPFPALWRRPGAEDAPAQLLGAGGHATAAHWSANVVSTVDPGTLCGWGKAVAAAATVALAGVGAGAAISEREAARDFLSRAPVNVGLGGSGDRVQDRALEVRGGAATAAGKPTAKAADGRLGSTKGSGGSSSAARTTTPGVAPSGGRGKPPPPNSQGAAGAPSGARGGGSGANGTHGGTRGSGGQSGTGAGGNGASLTPTLNGVTQQVQGAVTSVTGAANAAANSVLSQGGVAQGIAAPVLQVVDALGGK